MIENKGMCPPMSDRDFYNLLTDNGLKNIEIVLKFYPRLSVYVK